MNAIQVEIVNSQEPTITTIITVVIILLIGFILTLIGKSSNKPSLSFLREFVNLFKNKRFLNSMGIVFMIFGVSILILYSNFLRDNLVAFAVIFATVFSAISLRESEKLRKEYSDNRKKETLEKGLDRINRWLIQVMGHISILSRHVSSPIELKQKIMDCRAELTNDVATSINTLAIRDQIMINSLITQNDKDELFSATTEIDKILRDYVTILFDIDLENITIESAENVLSEVENLTRHISSLLKITARISFGSTSEGIIR